MAESGKARSVSEILSDAGETFMKRESQYGSAYKSHGLIMSDFFPDGITLKTPEDFARYSLFGAIIGKLNRYAPNFQSGGHQDSIHDAINYSAMLEHVDEYINSKKESFDEDS